MSERRRLTTGLPFSQGLLFTILLIASLTSLSGCGPGQTDTGQTNSVPVNLSISFPQKSASAASASTRGSRFWATLQPWLPTLADAWAQTTADLDALTVEVTGPGLQPPITKTVTIPPPKSGQVIPIELDVPAGPNRVFTVSGQDATKRTISGGNSSPLTLTAGQPVTVDIDLTELRAGPLTNARGYHTATLLPTGQVLVVGGT